MDEKWLVILLVCGGATVAGVYSVFEKRIFRDRKAPVVVSVVATMSGAGSFLSVAQFVQFGVPHVSMPFWGFFAVTAVLNVGIVYFQQKALSIEDASIVVPLRGITPILVILTSWLILRERVPTVWGLLGILTTVLGVYFLGLKWSDIRSVRGLVSPWSRLVHSGGARLAILPVVLGSISLNFDKLMVAHSTPAMRGALVFLFVAIVVLGVSVVRGQWQKLDKSYFLPLFGIGLCMGLSNLLMDWGFAFGFGIVAYVGSLKRFQIVVTTILSVIFLHERDKVFRIVASIIIFGGLLLLAF